MDVIGCLTGRMVRTLQSPSLGECPFGSLASG